MKGKWWLIVVAAGLMVVLQACSSGGGNPGGQVSISISPTSANLQPGGTKQFTARVTGTSNTAVNWKASGGFISGTGNTITYTAPNGPGSYKVTATSKDDSSKSATATVTVAASVTCTDPVNIPDANLKTAIESQLGISSSPTCAQMQNLTALKVEDGGIQSLEGLQYATSLTTLDLRYTQISDLGPLANLTSLTFLGLSDNRISDISPLAGLTNLAILELGDNRISDIQPLVNNTGLGSGDTVNISANCLDLSSGSAASADIATLVGRGVSVIDGGVQGVQCTP